MSPAGSSGGRRKKRKAERVMLGLRVTPELKERLDASAAQSGRSQSQEAEFRLERSFDRSDLLSEVLALTLDRKTAGIALAVGNAMAVAGLGNMVAWGDKRIHDDPFTASWTDKPKNIEMGLLAGVAFLLMLLPDRKALKGKFFTFDIEVSRALLYAQSAAGALRGDEPPTQGFVEYFRKSLTAGVPLETIRSLLGPDLRSRLNALSPDQTGDLLISLSNHVREALNEMRKIEEEEEP